MKKLILLFVLLMATVFGYAQVEEYTEEELIEKINSLNDVQKDSLVTALIQLESGLKEQQVKTIGGIEFGISREEAQRLLGNKYGEPEYTSNNTLLTFKQIKYAGRDFDVVHFLFQSDGRNSYLYACIFIKEAKSQTDVKAILDGLYGDLSKKYIILDEEGSNGFTNYFGGISPLWDGNLVNFNEDYYSAWHTDVIEYEYNIRQTLGIKYGVRLIYGPYEFVHEEF